MTTSSPRRILGPAVLAMTAACFTPPPTVVPIPIARYELAAEPSSDLLVLLPGIGDEKEDFERRGLVGDLMAAREEGRLPFDVWAVDAHFGYYQERSLLTRLRDDVFEPARRAGYERIHLLGISLGGYGSLLYLRKDPESITSITLLAPYLGTEADYAEARANGFEELESPPGPNLWPWLENLPQEEREKLWLGYGHGDDYAVLQGRLADLLPSDRTVRHDGGHDWGTWSRIWPELLSRHE